MNIASASKDSELMALMKNTVTNVFPFTYELREDQFFNSLLFAFREKPDFSLMRLDRFPLELQPLLAKILRGLDPVAAENGGAVSTDNASPIEFLTEKMVVSKAL